MGAVEDRLERLAEHRAEQIPAFSMPPTDELALRRDLMNLFPEAKLKLDA